MEQVVPIVFEYMDYRRYLEAYRMARKEWDQGFTHSYICFFLGQKSSRTLFSNIVAGRRNLSQHYISQFVKLLELDKEEANYFRILVLYNQSCDPDEKELYFDQLVQLNVVSKRELNDEYAEYYSHWYHSALRSLLDCVNWKIGDAGLATMLIPPITAKEAEASIALLLKTGLIAENSDGYLKPTDAAISSGAPSKVLDPYVKKYQLQTLEQAKLALMNDNPENYKSATLTMSTSKEAMQQILKRAEQFRKEVIAIVKNDEVSPENVYQLNIQLVKQSGN